MHNNYILTSANGPLSVTNISVSPGGLNTLGGLPLGTSDGSATGEVAVKVLNVGGGGGGGQVEGMDAINASPAANPFVAGFIDGDNSVQYASAGNGFPVTVVGNPQLMVSSGSSGFYDGDAVDRETLPILISGFGSNTSGTPNQPNLVVYRIPTLIKSVNTSTTGSTAVWTPSTGTQFRLMRFAIFATGNAAITSGGVVTVTLEDGSTPILSIPIYLPATAGVTLGLSNVSGWIDLGAYGYLSSAANNVLNLNLSSALSAGKIAIICNGNEEQ